MPSIQHFMAGDHRHCDDLFVAAEQAVLSANWTLAGQAFARFQQATLGHFSAEETQLFPAFEAQTGMRQGPTQVMRQEHAQMRELMQAAAQAVIDQDANAYAGEAETLLIMMQQHNLKEENILYPLCDQHLSAQAETLVSDLSRTLTQGHV